MNLENSVELSLLSYDGAVCLVTGSPIWLQIRRTASLTENIMALQRYFEAFKKKYA